MLDFIFQYWLECVFGLIIALVGAGYRGLRKDLKRKTMEEEALKKGMVAILRQSLYDSYNKWSEKGYCPINALEVCRKIYEQYHALGGNDIGTELYERLKDLPPCIDDVDSEKEIKR